MDYSEQSERMLSFFNLKHDPFGSLVDTMVYSGAGGRYEIAETIRHLLTYSQQDSLVAGFSGSGKRTLAQQVLKLIEDYWRVAWIDAREVQTLEAAFKEIIGQFGLGLKPETDSETLLQQIISKTQAQSEEDGAFLIVVQHACDLPPEMETAFLSLRTLAQDLDSRIRQLWLADDVSKFSIPLNEDEWYIHLLEGLTDSEAGLYLRDRLAAAGGVNHFPIAEKDVARLNELAQGQPARLNELARDYLISATFKTTEKKQGFPVTHVIAGIAALCLIVIAFLYQVNDKPKTVLSSPVEKTTGELSEVEKRLAEAVAKVEAKQLSASATDSTNEQTSPMIALEPSADEVVASPAEEIQEVVVPTATNLGEVPLEGASSNSEVAVLQSTEESVQQDLPMQQKADGLLAIAADSEFTMQLIGLRDRAKLTALMSTFVNQELLAVIDTSHEGKPWYVLIYGQYPSKAAAQNDIATLPKEFSDVQPWIRSFKSIRDDLK